MSQLNDSYWFNLFTRVIYLHVMTGNFWKPDNFEVGTNDVKGSSSINIFPNPIFCSNYLKINGLENIKSIGLFTISGQPISSMEIKDESLTLDVSSLAKGTYIVKGTTLEGTQQNLKFIK